MTANTTDTVRRRFLAPLREALAECPKTRPCPEYPDGEHLICGVGRVVELAQSGRGWVQRSYKWISAQLSVNGFFKALRSRRRLAMVEDVATRVLAKLNETCNEMHDPLAGHEELDGYDVYASDGHYEAAASHAEAVGKSVAAAGYFYSLNLRSHGLTLLDVARPRIKKEHDMSVLKRLKTSQLRLGAPKGRRVIHVYDPAGIDYYQWFKWKSKGMYIISREKANSTAMTSAIIPVDRNDPRNNGVVSDEYVGVFCGVMMRRVKYLDPATGTEYSFMTSEMNLPPGIIAFLYKLRWDVEKVFDEKKNKLGEKKAWATTPEAKCQQAHFVCLAHNLLVMLERTLEHEEGIRDEKVNAKRQKRLEEVEQRIRESGRARNPLVMECTRITQRSLQFIRWLRDALRDRTPWRPSIERLRPLMEKYIT